MEEQVAKLVDKAWERLQETPPDGRLREFRVLSLHAGQDVMN